MHRKDFSVPIQNWLISRLPHDYGTISNPATGNDVADANLDYIATTQFAIDGEVGERPSSEPPVLI